MADEQDLDRNEAATPHKLLKAQEKGQVAKSPEVISALVWAAASVYLTWKGWDSVRDQFVFDQSLLLRVAGLDPDGGALWPLVSRMAKGAMMQLLPFFAVIMLTAALANLVQTGPMFTTDPLKADFDRLNPVNGFKKVFSMRTLFDAARACVKLVLLAGVSWLDEPAGAEGRIQGPRRRPAHPRAPARAAARDAQAQPGRAQHQRTPTWCDQSDALRRGAALRHGEMVAATGRQGRGPTGGGHARDRLASTASPSCRTPAGAQAVPRHGHRRARAPGVPCRSGPHHRLGVRHARTARRAAGAAA
jgi:hypothetical protein